MKTVLITGGTSGIGLELVGLFAADLYHVVVVARSKRMPTDAPKVTYIQQDLSQPESPKEIFDTLKRRKITVDVLVNNAGFGAYGRFTDIDLNQQMSMISVNISALTELTYRLLPDIIDNRGKILNVASTAAFSAGPFMSVYFATKHYVLNFSESLQAELKNSGVTVTALCPGPTKTRFEDTAKASSTRIFRRNTASAKDVAKYGYQKLHDGTPLAVHGFRNKILVQLLRFLPRALVRDVMYRNLRP